MPDDWGYDRRPDMGLGDLGDGGLTAPDRLQSRRQQRATSGGTVDRITAGIIEDEDKKFTIDLSEKLLTVKDDQSTPATRVRLGKLGSGDTDYGIEILDASGGEILTATGLGIGTVDTAQLVDGAVATAKLADLAVIEGKINNAAVTTAKMFDGAVTEVKLGDDSVATVKIQDEAVVFNKVAARAIAARHLFVGSFDNLVANPGFEQDGGSLDGWTTVDAGGTWALNTTTFRSGQAAVEFDPTGQTGVSSVDSRTASPGNPGGETIAATEGDQIYAEAYARKESTGTPNQVRMRIRWQDESGSALGFANGTLLTPTTSWQKISVTGTAPAGTVSATIRPAVQNDGNSEILLFDDVYARRMVEGSIVVDGTITADHLTVSTLDAITASMGTLTAGEISVGGMTLSADGPYMSFGAATAYGTGNGIWMEYTGTVGRLRVGDPAGQNLSFDGTDLSLDGRLNISDWSQSHIIRGVGLDIGVTDVQFTGFSSFKIGGAVDGSSPIEFYAGDGLTFLTGSMAVSGTGAHRILLDGDWLIDGYLAVDASHDDYGLGAGNLVLSDTLWFRSASDSVDTNLYRASANTLATDDDLQVGGQFSYTGPLNASISADSGQNSINLFTNTAATRRWHFTARGASYATTAEQEDLILFYHDGSSFQRALEFDSATRGAVFSSTLEVSDHLIIKDGAVGDLGLYFAGATTTGIYQYSSDALGIAAGGTLHLSVGLNNNVTVHNGQLDLPASAFDTFLTSGGYELMGFDDTGGSEVLAFGIAGGMSDYHLAILGAASPAAGHLDVAVGKGTAISTSATEGFLLVPTCAGPPTGTPTNASGGWVPLAYDQTNHELYLYSGSWRSVGVT